MKPEEKRRFFECRRYSTTSNRKESGELINVEDNGPGLPGGEAEKMFLPFTQAGEDRSGLGLGLSIAKRGIEANGGTLCVRNKIAPSAGCVFTIDLPRHSAPETMKV